MSGIITALEIQQKNQERVNVFIDHEFAFGLNLLDAAHLKKGQELSDADIASLQRKDEVVKAIDSAVRFLAHRPRSTHEIRQRLVKKGYSANAIEDALERLETLKYVDDLAFARYWVRNREEFSPRGERALQYELRQKGLDSETIAEAIGEIDAVDAAYRAAQKKVRSLRHKERSEVEKKLGGFLARRGFGYDVVRTVLDRIYQEWEAEDALIDDET